MKPTTVHSLHKIRRETWEFPKWRRLEIFCKIWCVTYGLAVDFTLCIAMGDSCDKFQIITSNAYEWDFVKPNSHTLYCTLQFIIIVIVIYQHAAFISLTIYIFWVTSIHVKVTSMIYNRLLIHCRKLHCHEVQCQIFHSEGPAPVEPVFL